MSVDIAASTGSGLAVAGTTVVDQGLYLVPPHTGTINEAITAADPTNPRVDQVIVQCLDNVLDGSAGNRAQTIVLTGTPTGGATIGIGGNRSGAASLPASSYRLADVLVPAGSSSVTNANIFDRRPKARGHTNIATSEATSSATYTTLTTPDRITEIVLPTDGLIAVTYHATWVSSVSQAGRAALFLGANQLQIVTGSSPAVQEASTTSGAGTTNAVLATASIGLGGGNAASYTGDITTGQILGVSNVAGSGGPVWIFAAAGTYTISVQFKATSGSVTALNRTLSVWTMAPDLAMLA